MKYRKIKNYEVNAENPFVEELFSMKISSRKRYLAGKSPSVIVNPETGEVEGNQIFAIEEKKDTEEFTKVFRAGLMGMFNLSKSAMKVFAFIADKIKPNSGHVYFEMDECMAFTGYKSQTPIVSGLSELIEHGFIARSKLHYKFFINPNMFFNGNRVTFIKSYKADSPMDFKLLIDKKDRALNSPDDF